MTRTTRINSHLTVGDTARADSLGRLNPLATSRRGGPPRIVSLIAGTDDETLSATSCTITADTTNFKVGRQGWQVTTAGAVAARATLTPIPPATSGLLTVPPAQSVCLWVYLPDATKVTSINPILYQDTGNTISWSRSTLSNPAQTLVNGWNLLRWKAVDGVITNWGTLNRVDVYVNTNAATSATLGHLYLECPERARMIFVLDRGYKSFVTSGALARLRAAKVPVTWALDVTLLGQLPGDRYEVVTEADIARYAALGDSVSFHGWDGSPTVSMTAAQVRADTAKCVKWLQARGYAGRMWRAAWVQNSATNGQAINDMVVAHATSTSSASLDTWPPRNRWDMPRSNFYGKTTTQIDTQFSQLQKTNGLYVIFNHGIDPAGGNDATPAEFDYWMTKAEAALSAGWLEAVTFEQLLFESGFQFGDLSGGTTLQLVDKGVAATIQAL